jgi:hypothetical protein
MCGAALVRAHARVEAGAHMQWLEAFAATLATTVSNAAVWPAVAQGLILAAAMFALGWATSRVVGLLRRDAPQAELIAVSLGTGLLVGTSLWAALASAGRSAFTPIALGFLVAIGLAVLQRWRGAASAQKTPAIEHVVTTRSRTWSRLLAALGCAAFIVAAALLYGSTQALSPRDGEQPVEFNDVAFYSVLASDLAATGEESTYSPSGFGQIAGVPVQMWYHWGEIWLASVAITLFGTAPLLARHLAVLPVLLLAAATLSGTLVRVAGGTSSRVAFAFGFLACLVLAPIPFLDGPFFSSWAVGLVSGITIYGLAAVAVPLALYSLFVMHSRSIDWPLAIFVGTLVAAILPAHLVIALLTYLGIAVLLGIRLLRSFRVTARLRSMSSGWMKVLLGSGVMVIATAGWGIATGHGVAPSAAPPVAPYNATWQASVAITVLGAGVLVSIGIAAVALRRDFPVLADLCVAALAVVTIGAAIWGARLSDFTMFYFFFAGIAVIATPIGAMAIWALIQRIQASGYRRWALTVAIICAFQLALGTTTAMRALQLFGPNYYPPISVLLLDAIKELPADAKIAYSCKPFQETGFVGATLLTINAHTGHRVVPMCYEAEVLDTLVGLEPSTKTENAYFRWAPQRELFPTDVANPPPEAVRAFLKAHGVGYIYVDAIHPNTLIPDAMPVASAGSAEILRIP